MPKTIFDPRTRTKALEEVIYPAILHSMWQTENKICAMYRHKIRIEKSIERIEDAEKREELYSRVNDLYLNYIALLGFAPVEVRKCEAEVEKEDIRAKICTHAREHGESSEEVPTTTRWIKAHVKMLLALSLKKSYTQQVYTRKERIPLEEYLMDLERKLAAESDSQVKADIAADIERVRELLIGE